MDVLEAIRTRHSIRAYTDQEVPETTIQELLEAAMCAPSAGNARPWHFVVMRDRAVLDAVPSFHPYAKMMLQSNAAILVCGDAGNERFGPYWVQDCAAAIENMLLAAHGRGLGAVWLGLHPRKERKAKMRELVGMPEEMHSLGIVCLGYPKETKDAGDRYDSTRVHLNRW